MPFTVEPLSADLTFDKTVRGLTSQDTYCTDVCAQPYRHWIEGGHVYVEKINHSGILRAPNATTTGGRTAFVNVPGDGIRIYADTTVIDHVYFNSVQIVRHGANTGSMPGTVFRSGRADRTVMLDSRRAGLMSVHTLSAAAPVPGHVDPGAVIDFDFYADPRLVADGTIHRAMARMAQDEGRGIFWTPRNGGHWCINSRALLFEAMRDTALFSSCALTLPPMPVGQEPRVLPISLDGEEHLSYRMPLLKAFAPAPIKAMEPAIRAFAAELIEAVRGDGHCDFVAAIGEPLPVVIFMQFMGLDVARLSEFRGWVADMLSASDERRASSHAKILAMLAEVLAKRRAEPRDDLITRLIAGEVRGRPIADDEALAFCLLLFAAGLDTVANALAFGMNHLARDPVLQDRLRSTPASIPAAVEELLRLYGIANVVRVITRDTEWGGAQIKAGERVLMMLTVGNYDDGAHRDPARFDPAREGEPHITFGLGPHRCVGSHLARLELNTFWAEWFARMPNIAVDTSAAPVLRGGQTLALGALPLIWSAAPEISRQRAPLGTHEAPV